MEMPRRWRCGVVVVLALVLSSPAQADGPGALRDASLASACAPCHGTDGRALTGSPVPGIAGMERNRLRDALQAYRHDTRAGTVMPQIAKGYDDDEIDRLAAFFAAQKTAGSP